MKTSILALSLVLLSHQALLAAEKLRVVSLSTVLTELAQRVGGEDVTVTGLIKPGVDPHDFEPKPEDLKQVAASQIVLLSAKHMEGYVDKLHEAAGTQAVLLEVGNQVPSIKSAGGHHHHHHAEEAKKESAVGKKEDHDHDHESEENPHWWHSIENMRRAARVLQTAFAKQLPSAKDAFATRAGQYVQELDDLEKWTKREIAKIPRNKRKLVTTHDAFQYFAQEFGFKLFPLEGITAEDQPSSKEVAELIEEIKEQKVPAVFIEDVANTKVTDTITKETGAKMGGMLYADGLGEGEAGTFVGMYKHNVNTIVEALK